MIVKEALLLDNLSVYKMGGKTFFKQKRVL